MIEYVIHELLGIIINGLFLFFLSFISFSNQQKLFSGIFLIMALLYLFLKLFDLSGLYPTELWILFNFYQNIIYFSMLLFIFRISNFLKKHNGGY